MEKHKNSLPHTPHMSQNYNGWIEDKLLFQQCKNCAEIMFPTKDFCTKCMGRNLALKISKGKGKIQSFIVIHEYAPFDLMGDGKLPYASVLVNMDEGFRINGYIVECDFDKLQSNMTVEVNFDPNIQTIALQKFQLIKETENNS